MDLSDLPSHDETTLRLVQTGKYYKVIQPLRILPSHGCNQHSTLSRQFLLPLSNFLIRGDILLDLLAPPTMFWIENENWGVETVVIILIQ